MAEILVIVAAFVIGVTVGAVSSDLLARRAKPTIDSKIDQAHKAAMSRALRDHSHTTAQNPHPAGSKLARKAAEGRLGRGQPQ